LKLQLSIAKAKIAPLAPSQPIPLAALPFTKHLKAGDLYGTRVPWHFRLHVIYDQQLKNSKEPVQMTSKKHRLIVYGIAVQLLLVAIVCYAAFPVKKPQTPIRIMYETNAGKVLFDHQAHASQTGYGLDCFDCHHHPPDDKDSLMACSECHLAKPEEGKVPESCLNCHDASDVEDTEVPSHAVALHSACTECHLEFGKGPIHKNSLSEAEQKRLKKEPNPWVDCSKCHVLKS
jgi:hypothetical protein